jgi:hypothetical protein
MSDLNNVMIVHKSIINIFITANRRFVMDLESIKDRSTIAVNYNKA